MLNVAETEQAKEQVTNISEDKNRIQNQNKNQDNDRYKNKNNKSKNENTNTNTSKTKKEILRENIINILKRYDKEKFFNTKKILRITIKQNRKAYEVRVKVKKRSCRTDRYKYFIKESKYEYSLNKLIYEVLDNIRESDFKNVPKEKMVLENGKIYNVSENIKIKNNRSRRVSYKNIIDIISVTSLLKNFKDIKILREIITRSADNKEAYEKRKFYGKWFIIYKKKCDDILLFKEMIEKKMKDGTFDDFDVLYYAHINEMYKQIIKAVEILKETRYLEKSKEAEENLSICHHDLEYHNVLKLNKTKTLREYYLIDFEYMIFDMWHHDIGSFIKRVVRSNNFLEKEIESEDDKIFKLNDIRMKINLIIKTYELEDDDDLEIIKSLIIFPEEFWQVGFQRYVEKQNWMFDRFIRRLNKAIVAQINKDDLIKILDENKIMKEEENEIIKENKVLKINKK